MRKWISTMLVFSMLILLGAHPAKALQNENETGQATSDMEVSCGELSVSESSPQIKFDFSDARVFQPEMSSDMVTLLSEPESVVYRGASGKVVYIDSAEELADMSADLSASYILTADIDLNGSEENPWEPIGGPHNPFTGSFDGAGYAISGLYINNPDTSYQGLFAYAEDAIIQNFSLTGSVTGGLTYVGGVVGYLSGGSLSGIGTHCSVQGFDHVGGLVGYNDGGNISNCANYDGIDQSWIFQDPTHMASVWGEMHAGGIAGFNTGKIYSCNNYGQVRVAISAEDPYNKFEQVMFLGGIAGSNENAGVIEHCGNSGFIYANAHTVDYKEDLTYKAHIGGIAGFSEGDILLGANYGDVSIDWHVASYGVITTEQTVGGIAGSSSGVVSRSVNEGRILIGTFSGGIVGHCLPGGSVADCQNEAPVNASAYWTGTGYTASVYGGGIIGRSETDNAIKNCSNQGAVYSYASSGGSDATRSFAGGVVGSSNPNGSAAVTACANSGKITALADGGARSYPYARAGGIAGDSRDTEILCCSNTGTVYSHARGSKSELYAQAGGIAGLAELDVYDCYNTGALKAESQTPAQTWVGGIVAYYNNYSDRSIRRCYHAGSLSGTNQGLMCAYEGSDSVLDCYALESSGPADGCTTLLTESEMTRRASFPAFDFDDVWKIEEGEGYPVLQEQSEVLFKRVTFDLNGGSGTCPQQNLYFGDLVERPKDPVKDGERFVGWYANPYFRGAPWDFEKNTIRSDVVLYAKWDSLEITEIDVYNFRNHGYDFYGSTYDPEKNDYPHRISDEYFELLKSGLTRQEKWKVKQQRSKNWGGSCFGIAHTLAMFKLGQMDTDFFFANTEIPRNLPSPAWDSTGVVESMINYYQLIQFTGNFAEKAYKKTYSSNQQVIKESLKKLVSDVEAAEENGSFVAMLINRCEVTRGEDLTVQKLSVAGGHIVYAYKVTTLEDGRYKLHLLDSNERMGNYSLRLNSSYITVDCDYNNATHYCDWNSNWNGISVRDLTLRVCAGVPMEELGYPNLQEELTKYGMKPATGASLQEVSLNEDGPHSFVVTTDAYGFELSEDGGKTVTHVEDTLVEGDADVELTSCFGEAEIMYNYTITSDSDEIQLYTPTELYRNDDCTMILSVDDAPVATVTSSAPLTLILNADGSIAYRTEESEAKVSVHMPIEDADVPWESVQVELSVPSAAFEPVSGGVAVSAEGSIGEVSAKAYLTYSEVTVSGVIEGDNVTVTAGFEDALALFSDGRELYGAVPSYSVAFFTGGGSYVATQDSIYYGNKVQEPEAPTRPGYKFSGWYTDKEFTDLWDFSKDKVTEDTTLYAKWSEDTQYFKTVIFRSEGFADQVIIVPVNTTLTSEEYPEVPARADCKGKWNLSDSVVVEDNMIVQAVYTSNKTADYTNGSVTFEGATAHGDVLVLALCNQSSRNLSGGVLMSAGYRNGQMVSLISSDIPASQAGQRFTISVSRDDLGDECDQIRFFALDMFCKPITAFIDAPYFQSEDIS